MHPVLPHVHLLTCPKRATMCVQTLENWARTDWPGRPEAHVDTAPITLPAAWGTPARLDRLTNAFATMLRESLYEYGTDDDWFLFLEDDLDFHPRLATHVAGWEALQDKNCWLASLFNSGMRARPAPHTPPHTFAAEANSFIGSQALLLRHAAAREALRQWDSSTGRQCQRLAKLFGHDRPLWVHQPSLVQHVAVDSSWGANIKRASDFDPAWEG